MNTPDPAPTTLTLPWGAQALAQRLQMLRPGLALQIVASTASTNSALLERAAAPAAGAGVRRSIESRAFDRDLGSAGERLLVAETQTGGRGRHGRTWHSRPGASLTFSLRVSIDAVQWSGLSLAVGVALCEALDAPPGPVTGRRLGLKWPNDLWLMDGDAAGRKLGGVLIETVAAGGRRWVVIGVGLNIRPFDAPPTETGFASLCELDPQASAPAALADVAPALIRAVESFERGGFGAFAQRYAARDVLRGRWVTTQAPQAGAGASSVHGVAQGVSEQGELLVLGENGQVRVSSGEVSVRLAPVHPVPPAAVC